MKWVFVGAFLIGVVLLVIANFTAPRDRHPEVVKLIWATDDNPARKEQIALFQAWHQETYGEPIKVAIDPANADMAKIIIQTLAGKGPDLFDVNWGRQHLERYVKSGIILDVTEAAKELGFEKEHAWEATWTSFVYEGRQYGFPANANNLLMVYHKSAFDQAGIPYPSGDWTWDEFLAVAKKLSYRTPGDKFRHYALLTVNSMDLLYQNGAQLFSEEGTRCTFDSPQAIAAMRFYQEMRITHKVLPSASDIQSMATTGGWGGGISLFTSGRFAMAALGRFWFVQFANEARAAHAQGKTSPYDDLGVAPMPYFTRPYTIVMMRSTAVNRKSPRAKYAVRFLQFLASEPYNRQVNRTYDCLAPAVEYCTGPSGIADGPPPPRGMECVNSPLWAESMAHTSEVDASPFIPTYRSMKIWEDELAKLDVGNVSPEQMLRTFTRRVNEEIQRNIAKDAKLKQRYEEALAKEKE